MDTVISADGTAIAFQRIGDGPAIVVVPGALGDHTTWEPVARHLSGYSIWAIDRRGTGASGDAAGYAPDREVEDVLAVLAAAGGRAHLLGHSSGAILALMTASRQPGLDRLVLYEPPIVAGTSMHNPALAGRLRSLLATGDREAALEAFLLEREPEPNLAEINAMRSTPVWPLAISLAHTFPYHVELVQSYDPDPVVLSRIEIPTLLVLGGDSPAYMRAGTERLVAALPHPTLAVLPGQGHRANLTGPDVLAEAVGAFLAG